MTGKRIIIGRKGRLHIPKIWGTWLTSEITLTRDDSTAYLTDASVYIAECREKHNEPSTNSDHGRIFFNGQSDKKGLIKFTFKYEGDVPVIVRVRHRDLPHPYEEFSMLTPKGIDLPVESTSGYPY